MTLRLRATVAAALLTVALAGPARSAATEVAPDGAQLAFFESKIRPLLAEHCYGCHSSRSSKLKANLYLDSRAGLLTGGDSGPAVVPGEPARSRLIDAVRHTGTAKAMPPKGKLSDTAVADLTAWVNAGAPWTAAPTAAAQPATAGKPRPDFKHIARSHWAYRPIRDVAPPVVRDAAWPRSDLDRFILAALEVRGLSPNADADRATLARRVTFDLTGLPPTPEEVDAFLSDASPDAYEKLVDRLLASPQFGERWGRHWMDVARYAESLTLRGFVLKDVWRYRDYVIDAFNADRPYDQFVRDQVAGDLLPAADLAERRRRMAATTFLAIGNTNLEEQDKRQLRMDVVDEQLETIGKAFLGQTIGCARCHDHKFDPITARDYYALAGILASVKTLEHSNVSRWIDVPLPETPEREAQLVAFEQSLAPLKNRIRDAKAAVARAKGQAVSSIGGSVPVTAFAGIVIDDTKAKRIGEWTPSTSADSYVGDGYLIDGNEGKGDKSLTFQIEIPRTGKYEVRFAYTASTNRAKKVPVTVFGAGGEKEVFVNEQAPPPVEGRWVSLGRHEFEKDGQAYVEVSNEGTSGQVIADAVQLLFVDEALETASTGGANAAAAAPVSAPKAIAAKLDKVPTADEIKKMEAELKRLTAAGPKRDTIVSVVEETPADLPLHVRGSVHTLGDTVPRGFPAAIAVADPPPIPPTESGRAQLADWLTRGDNPLPARVMVNRAWHWLTGEGIVRTVDNFGTTGEPPSHPELLDHLAARFIRDGWSVKRLVRSIVLSRTYQLASTPHPAAHTADPENRLRARADRRRLEAEQLRDAMLTVSGQLDLTRPDGPAFAATLASDYSFKHVGNRRSVYAPVFRNALPDFYGPFDFADPSVTTGRRNTSTVAGQALFLMNHPFVREQAAHAATNLLHAPGLNDDAARLSRAYRLTLGRAPAVAERQVFAPVLADAATAAPDGRLAAWTQIFHALFASPEFRFVE